jgi:CHRD domain
MKHLCRLFLFSVALVVGTCSAHGAAVVTTTLLGSKLIPPIASTATGRAVATLQSDNKTLEVDVTFVGLTVSATRALIHCCGSPGVNALVAVTLPGFPSTTSGHYVNTFDLSVDGTYTASFITAHGGTVDSAKAAFITALKTRRYILARLRDRAAISGPAGADALSRYWHEA